MGDGYRCRGLGTNGMSRWMGGRGLYQKGKRKYWEKEYLLVTVLNFNCAIVIVRAGQKVENSVGRRKVLDLDWQVWISWCTGRSGPAGPHTKDDLVHQLVRGRSGHQRCSGALAGPDTNDALRCAIIVST
jgi:hypothetical protein